jgi:hypothetical protein
VLQKYLTSQPATRYTFDHRLLLVESHLTRRLFGGMVRRIDALPVPGTAAGRRHHMFMLRLKKAFLETWAQRAAGMLQASVIR